MRWLPRREKITIKQSREIDFGKEKVKDIREISGYLNGVGGFKEKNKRERTFKEMAAERNARYLEAQQNRPALGYDEYDVDVQ